MASLCTLCSCSSSHNLPEGILSNVQPYPVTACPTIKHEKPNGVFCVHFGFYHVCFDNCFLGPISIAIQYSGLLTRPSTCSRCLGSQLFLSCRDIVGAYALSFHIYGPISPSLWFHCPLPEPCLKPPLPVLPLPLWLTWLLLACPKHLMWVERKNFAIVSWEATWSTPMCSSLHHEL